MTTTPVIAAILLLLVTLLAINVSVLRMRLRISLGDGDNKQLGKAIRAHANALEHCVPFILLLFFYEKQGCGCTAAWIGGAFIAARLAHAWAMLGGPFNLRRLGASVTVLLQLFLALAILRAAL